MVHICMTPWAIYGIPLWEPWILLSLSFDVVTYFLHTPTGNYIFTGAIVAFILVTGLTYRNYSKEAAGHRKASLLQTFNAMYAFPVVVGLSYSENHAVWRW